MKIQKLYCRNCYSKMIIWLHQCEFRRIKSKYHRTAKQSSSIGSQPHVRCKTLSWRVRSPISLKRRDPCSGVREDLRQSAKPWACRHYERVETLTRHWRKHGFKLCFSKRRVSWTTEVMLKCCPRIGDVRQLFYSFTSRSSLVAYRWSFAAANWPQNSQFWFRKSSCRRARRRRSRLTVRLVQSGLPDCFVAAFLTKSSCRNHRSRLTIWTLQCFWSNSQMTRPGLKIFSSRRFLGEEAKWKTFSGLKPSIGR